MVSLAYAVFACYLCLILVPAQSQTESWSLTDGITMPGELRVANEGLTNDGTNIYMNSKSLIFKCELDSEGKQLKVVKEEKLITDDLHKQGYNHVGDIDFHSGYIYAGLEWSSTSPGILAVYDSTTLKMLKYAVTDQEGMPWVAVSVDGTKLYSTHWNEKSFINVYNATDFSILSQIKTDPTQLPGEIQGAAFWEREPKYLYLLSNGPYVHRVNIDTGDVEFVLEDNEYAHHVYEAEGITFMDLEDRGLGTMHLFGNFQTLEEKSIHNFRLGN